MAILRVSRIEPGRMGRLLFPRPGLLFGRRGFAVDDVLKNVDNRRVGTRLDNVAFPTDGALLSAPSKAECPRSGLFAHAAASRDATQTVETPPGPLAAGWINAADNLERCLGALRSQLQKRLVENPFPVVFEGVALGILAHPNSAAGRRQIAPGAEGLFGTARLLRFVLSTDRASCRQSHQQQTRGEEPNAKHGCLLGKKDQERKPEFGAAGAGRGCQAESSGLYEKCNWRHNWFATHGLTSVGDGAGSFSRYCVANSGLPHASYSAASCSKTCRRRTGGVSGS